MDELTLCSEIHQKIGNVSKVLDIGCGEGYLVNCLAKKLNKKVTGFDISNDGFVKSHEKCKKFNTCSMIECVEGDAHKIDKYFQHKFDAIIFAYTLHHLERPLTALGSIRKILKDNGKIVIGDYWFTNRKKKEGCYRFTPKDIKTMLTQSNFRYLGEDKVGKNFVLIIGEKQSGEK